MKSVGYSIIYPPGCKELSESLRITDLRKRLNDLSAAFDKLLETDDFGDSDGETTRYVDSSTQPAKFDYLKGLLLLLTSPAYTEHHDRDIQLRVGICVCKMLKIFCPHNPFSGMLDEKSLVKNLLQFLLDCIQLMAGLRDKGDVIYSKLHTIFYICCQIDLFLWCATVEDESLLLQCIKTTFAIVKNISVWAWTEPSIILQMLLDMIVKVIMHSEGLLSRDVIAFMLQFLIEPVKTTQPGQHTFARDLILRTSCHLEYNIQMLLQKYLLVGTDNSDVTKASGCGTSPRGDPNAHESEFLNDTDSIGEHVYLIIYELHTIQNSIVAPILPTLELKLKSPSERDRKRSFRLLARLFSEPNSLLHDSDPALWDAFLGRFNDISEDIRKLCVYMVPQMIQQNPDLPRDQLLKCIQQRAYDQNDEVRLFVLRTVSSLVNEAPPDTVANDLYQLLIGRCRDKSLSIRKEAATSLANMYKRLVQEPQPPADRLSAVANGILHMYYHPSVDDKIIVERLFKSSLVPYHFETSGRVRALFTCYGLLDEASVRAVREMFRMQYTVTVLLKEILYLLSTQDSKKISVAGGTDLMDRLIALTNVLPKTDHKTVEQLKRFFNKVHSDESLRMQLVKLTKPTCTCFEATKIMRYLIKHIDNSSSSVTAGGAEAHAQYVRCVKILLERSAPVLFDKAFGQELVTQLVFIRETVVQSGSVGSMETLKALILLHSLSLYFTGILPTEGLASYLVNILSDDSISADITSPPLGSSTTTASTTTQEADPQTTHELALSVFCSLLNGPGRLCDNDSEVPDSCSYPLHTDSASDLIGRTKNILPLLKNFCSTGMSRQFPPVPNPVDSALQPLPPLPNGARLEEGKPARGNLKREANQRGVYLAGLAWRRERRRAKLAIQTLLALYKSAQRSRLAPEVEIKAAVDEVVKVCLACPSDSPDYIVCLTALGRIALRLPGVYNREFKHFTLKSLVPDVLARDSEIEESGKVGSPDRSNAAKRKQNRTPNTHSNSAADWIPDGCVPQSTRAKISATKLMSNWLRGLKIEEKPVAQAVIRLLHRIIIHNGDLTGQGKLAPGEMSRMRLVAATSWLKLAHSQSYVDSIEVDWYQSMTYILRDPCPQVRSRFLTKLNQGLYRLQLPLEYMAMFAHAPNVPDAMFKQRAKQLLAASIQRRRDFLDRYPSRLSDPKFLYALLPEFVLPYVIYLLAHVPEWTEPNDVDSLSRIKASLWFVMEPIVTRGHNFLFLRKIIERIKHTRDALAPEDAIANTKLYLTCDVALGLLLTRCSDLAIKDYIINVKLPKALFVATPTTFRNPDFEQLLNSSSRDAGSPTTVVRTPLIQFTPRKDSHTEKYLMPAELLKGKRRAPAAPGSEPPEDVDNRSKPVPSQSCGHPVQTLATTVAAASSSKPTCPVATRQTKLVSYALPKRVSSDAARESVSAIGGAEQPSSLLDCSLSPDQTTPKKRVHIVLDTPEVGLDTGGSSLKEHTRHLSNSMSRVKCQRLFDVPNKSPAKSPPFQVESSRFTTVPKKPNIRSAPPKKELAQVGLASRTRRPKSHQQTTKSALRSSTPSSTSTSALASSTSAPPHSQALTRKRGRPPKGSTSIKQLGRQTRSSALKSRK